MSEKPLQIRAAFSPRIDKDTNESEELRMLVIKAFDLFFDAKFGQIDDEAQAANMKALEELTGQVIGKYRTENGDMLIKMVFNSPEEAVATAMYCEEDI